MKSINAPLTYHELTPRWLTKLLRDQKLIDGLTSVREILSQEIGEMKGVNSEVALLNIGYEDGEGPTQIIAKSTPAMPLPVATFQRWYEREINFYNEFFHLGP